MFRNGEFRTMLIVMSLVSLVGIGMSSLYSATLAVMMLIFSLALICCAIFFTMRRYQDIQELSDYLRHISAGDFSLDVRDNHEGELSILKSNIYKVTSMLANQSQLLEEDKKRLTDAISDISHQLKTPLTSMMVMADLLDNANLPTEKRAEFTNNMHAQLKRIEWLVSSLLKLSKIEAGSVTFKQEKVMIDELIKKVTVQFLIQMDVKEQRLTINGDQSLSFIGDFNWTAEALINIIKNAIEHTPVDGEITISSSGNALFTEIAIADNGPGIPRKDIPYLFQRFYKGKNASDDSVGIGLAMAQRIIASQNGDIEVTSEEGQGTEFRIKFYK